MYNPKYLYSFACFVLSANTCGVVIQLTQEGINLYKQNFPKSQKRSPVSALGHQQMRVGPQCGGISPASGQGNNVICSH